MDRNRLRGKRVDWKQTRPPASVGTQFDREAARSVPYRTGLRCGEEVLERPPVFGRAAVRLPSMKTMHVDAGVFHQSPITSHQSRSQIRPAPGIIPGCENAWNMQR